MDKSSKIITPGKEEENPHMKMNRRQVVLSRLKRRLFRHVWLVRAAIILSVLLFIFLAGVFVLKAVIKSPFGYNLTLARNFILTPSNQIESFQGRTNILILGKGGTGHEAPDLTDTMIFASIDHLNSSITLISLPRDIWIPSLRTKLNSVYYWGNKKQANGGLILAKSTSEEIIGQPIHYALVVDFSGFKGMIDVLGGVDVNVECSFTDEKYPIAGRENDDCGGDPEFKCRYETIHFEQGTRHMDGETALKFVRSRNAEGDEGTDFARAARQQKVIAAIETKVVSREILFSPKKLLALKSKAMESMQTDIPSPAQAILARRFLQSRDNVESKVFPEDLLIVPPTLPKYDNLYVFIPKNEDWSEIHAWVKCQLEKNCS